ncbi:hypothetical protein L6472_02425 [Prevotella sp. E13-17]|uniref:Ig-like domain-containing protein n=1 Tax=Prevotella sp. E13-17 TaxID=2913616 RepID=UPI001EDB0C6C|nr:hypothetical protein [Prevotella sp. E13-17]UKK51467.1 hypothetical protein L6472_02425 [Prevotella sp. E13-17]
MRQLKNFLIKREQSQACLSFAKREKSRLLAKTLLTLALLITAATGAWADQLASSYSSNATLNAVTVSASMEVTIATGVTVTINNGLNITSGTLTVKGPGTLVVNGKAGSNGGNGETGGNGTPGSAAITGNIVVQDGATVQATGGKGGNGGAGDPENGGHGANGAAAISGNVTVQGGATVKATGGNGGNGGYSEAENGGNGGNGGNAFAGTLTYKGGTVTANGGNGGSNGGSDGGWGGSGGSAGKAFTTSVNFVSSDYILTDGSNAITDTQVTSKKKVVISPKVAVNSVTLAPTSATLTLGETETVTLTATVAPNDATDPTVKWNVTAGAEKVKLYKDENCSTEVGTAATDVLTVYAKGLAVGEATVTVTSNDDATKTAACTVTVIPSGPEVAWNKAKKTGTFTMPGGNVTLEPEYYPQAALTAAPTAINDVPATTDGAIVKAGTVANIGETETAQGTVMYYVSQTALDDDALLALAADAWTADVPTAKSLAQGQAYIYYYVRGNDSDTDEENFSDGDILAANALTVTIAAEPTYTVTFAEGTDPNEWTASPNADVKKGETVTVTYSGTRRVMGVKAEKKASESLIVNPVVGQIIGSDGKNYDANATLPDGVTKVAMIAYVGKDAETSTTYNHGLALALEDVTSTDINWCSQTSVTCLGTQYVYDDNSNTQFKDLAGIANTDALVGHDSHTHAAAKAARDYNSGTHPTGTSAWFLPSAGQWDKMATAAGSYANLKTNAGLQGGKFSAYWSSTECDTEHAWFFFPEYGAWNLNNKGGGNLVRACLAF